MPKKFQERLEEYAALGETTTALFGAAADLLQSLRSENGEALEVLTGDPVADASILRAMGVEKAIKDKWSVDLEQVLGFLGLLVDAFTTITEFYKG